MSLTAAAIGEHPPASREGTAGKPTMIQINAAARLPPKMAHAIKTTAFHHRSGRDRDDRSQRGYTRLRPVFHLDRTMKARVRQG
jgi:hypothetical protein